MNDLRVALRGLLRAPGTACVVVLTLALAIGANTAIFSVVQSVLLQPLPYPDEHRIVRVAATTLDGNENSFSDRGYWHFADNNRAFDQFGGYWGDWFTLTGVGAPRQALVGLMTLSAFEVLGVLPERGRLPTPEEDTPGGPSVVLLSHELWVSRYGADPSILGRTVDLNGMPQEVIGVMPAGYDALIAGLDVDLWAPLQLDPASPDFGSVYITAIARLRPGVTIEAAISDARSLVARFDEAGYGPSWFESVFDGGAAVRPLRDVVVGDTREPLLILLGTVGFVLLIACSNVANLLLVRAEGRRRENAVRLALGSSRARLARHVAVESALFALLGGIGGVLLAHAGTSALVAMAPANIPRLGEIAIDGTALAFTAGVSLLAALLFGVLPALASSSIKTMGVLRDGGRGSTIGRARHRTRNVLVMSQVALAFMLVIGSGLMVRSFAALHSVDPGFSTDNVLTFTVQPLPTKYEDAQAVARFYDRLIERLEAVPGVTRAAAINTLPLAGWGCCWMPSVIDEFPPAEGERPSDFFHRRTTPGYFEAMSIPIIEGRAFTSDDHNQRLGSVIISRSVKDRYWPDTSTLGKRITVSGGIQTQVVGVVGDVHRELDIAPDRMLYLPMLDAEGANPGVMPVTAMTLTIRTSVEPLSLASAIRTAIAEVDPDVPMVDVRSMQRVLGDSVSRTRFMMSLLVIAALIALFLGAVGLYGVLSYVVSQRAPEIGLRLALGASPGAMRGMVVSQGLRLVGVGVLIGLIAAVALGQVMVTQLYGVNPVDPFTLAAAAAVFLTVAVLASVLPAGRAAAVAPMDTLRVG